MNVGQLIEALQKFSRDLDVICYTEDEDLTDSKRLFWLLDITEVRQEDAEKSRNEDGTPVLTFRHSDRSEPHVLIDVTTEF